MNKDSVPENTFYEYVEFRTHLREAIMNFTWDENITEEAKFKIVSIALISLATSAHNFMTDSELSLSEFGTFIAEQMAEK